MVKILVADDDEPELRAQLEWAARNKDRDVVMASSAEEAKLLIKQHDFDVIVTDLKMETETSGLDVLQAAKEKDIYVQVIMVTSYGTPDVSVHAMGLGAFDYLERNAPDTDHLAMVRSKITLALDYRAAVLNRRNSQ